MTDNVSEGLLRSLRKPPAHGSGRWAIGWNDAIDAVEAAALARSTPERLDPDANVWNMLDQFSGEHEPHRGNHIDYACGFSGPHCWTCHEPWPCRAERGVKAGPPGGTALAHAALREAEAAFEHILRYMAEDIPGYLVLSDHVRIVAREGLTSVRLALRDAKEQE